MEICPAAFAAGVLELAGGVEAAGFAFGHFFWGGCALDEREGGGSNGSSDRAVMRGSGVE